MAREAKREEVRRSEKNGVSLITYKCPFTDGDLTKEVTVTVPASASDLLKYLSSLQGDNLDTEYDRWLGATITAAKAAEREAVAADSTIVKRDGKDIDILAMRNVIKEGDANANMSDPQNVKIACAVINSTYMQSNAFGWDGVTSGKGTSAPQNAFIVARRKLLEAGKVKLTGEGKDYQKMMVPV